MRPYIFVPILIVFLVFSMRAVSSQDEVAQALRKAVEFHRTHVATEGGYLWKYSADLKFREGEYVADDQTVWVETPGTPGIGLSFLRAYRVTGDRYYLEAATEAGHCLLGSGGWSYWIYFDPERRAKYRYWADTRDPKAGGGSVLDDNVTQLALIFLMELDEALEFKDRAIHESVQYGLERLLAAQFPNGGYAQSFRNETREPAQYPILKASFPPEDTEPTNDRYFSRFYTFNDNLVLDINRVFFVAAEVYGTKKDGQFIRDEKYVEAAKRVGDFIILAQMPEPQPAWAQQYDFEMRPAWARIFEPAAISGGESQGVIDALIELYLFTGDKKYLVPIQPAIAYFERSRLPDGRLARFYELRTNRPLYIDKSNYKVTYSDDNLPTHYSFKVRHRSWSINELPEMDEQTRLQRLSVLRDRYHYRVLPPANDDQTTEVIQSLDERGTWVTDGTLSLTKNQWDKIVGQTEGPLEHAPGGGAMPIIDNSVFIRNINILLAALQAKNNK